MSIESDLIQTLYSRLKGTDSHGNPLTYGGEEVAIRTGNLDSDDPSPAVVIDRPRTRGSKFLGGESQKEVRQQLRVHTSFPEGRGDHLDAYDIAAKVQDLFEAAPITVDSKDLHVEEADRQPLPPQERGDTEALDLALSFTFHV
mgnify:CR=1 FL=1